MRKICVLALLSAVLLTLIAGPAAAQATSDEEGVLVRVDGDASVPAGETLGVVVVVEGDLDLQGTADTVVVVSGRADLVGATVETLVVVDGVAELGAGTRVTGDVHLVDSDIIRDPGATVAGSIESGTGGFSRGFWLVGFVFMLGWALMVLLAALVLAAVAPDFARRAGRTITGDLGPTILAGLILWIVVPLLGIVFFASLIGAAAALTIWFALLPALGLIGFLVAGVRLGEYVTGGKDGIGHPYLAAFVGVPILVAVGAVPLVGPIVVAVAGFLGTGALGVLAFRSVRSEPDGAALPQPAPPAPTAEVGSA